MSHCILTPLVLGALALGTVPALSQALTPGDILVTGNLGYDNHNKPTAYVREYTPGGSLVQQLSVPYPVADPGGFETSAVRGVTVDAAGRLAIYHGTFSPYLSVYTFGTGTWNQLTEPGWSTVNAGDFGGVVAYGHSVFATDDATAGVGQPSGIVQFNTDTGAARRFADGTDYIAVTLGQDGLLYALSGSGSPSGSAISVFDPATDALVRNLALPAAFVNADGGATRGIAVNAQGDIFLSRLYGQLYKLSPDGTVLANTQIPDNGNYCDNLSLSAGGQLMLAESDGTLAFTDQSFTSVHTVTTYGYYAADSFAAFVPAPEPSAPAGLALGALALAGLALKARRRAVV